LIRETLKKQVVFWYTDKCGLATIREQGNYTIKNKMNGTTKEQSMGIKSRELEPTKENIIRTIQEDLLERNVDVWQLARFCDAQEGRCSIAIDARWGDGKTFFIKQTQMLLEAKNPNSVSLSNEERAIVNQAFMRFEPSRGEGTCLEPQLCIYYDAWSNDNDTDPMLSLVHEITKTGIGEYGIKTSIDFGKAVAGIVDFFTGKNVKDLMALLEDRDALAAIRKQKGVQDLISEYLDGLLSEHGNRLIVFVDELDRCKPSFAVQLLERIKHYFTNDRITFVFSVNTDQLQHTIKRYYGDEFDACRYLDRFFDYRIGLPPANTTRYFEKIGLDNDMFFFEIVCKAIIKRFSFGLREAEKFYRTAKIAAYEQTREKRTNGFSEKTGMQFIFCFIVPLLIALRMRSISQYNQFIAGKDPNPMLELVSAEDDDIAQSYKHFLQGENETFIEKGTNSFVIVTLNEKIEQAYNAIFANRGEKTDYAGRIVVGQCAFTSAMKEEALKTASLLSIRASYDY
jgi:hypothetical protein